MTVQVLGVPKLDSPAGRAMYDVLVAAERDGNIDTIQALLHRGLDVNGRDREGETPLCGASSAGRSQTVRYLLERGAQIDLTDREQRTALYVAAENGYLDTVKLLITGGADPTIRTGGGKGLSPADVAWAKYHTAVYEFLEAQEQSFRTTHPASRE